MQEKRTHRQAALGEVMADIVLKHCRLVNVLSGEIEDDVEIALCGSEIVGVGSGYKGQREIDVAGRYVYPGLIDAHIHLESTKLTIPEVGRLMARFGTTAVITDPHEIANVAGLNGITYQMDCARDCNLIDVFFVAPSCVPTLPGNNVETCASDLDASKLEMLSHHPQVVGLGELMNVPGILSGDETVLQKIQAFSRPGLVIDGHAPMVSGKQLNTCIYMGVRSDHESTSLAEAREKLRRGMVVMIREGSSERNFDELISLVSPYNSSRIMFASDDLDPSDMMQRGHINHLLKRAVQKGIDPVAAIQMATINPAQYFGLSNRLGAIFPGAQANLVVSRDLTEFTPDFVVHHGQVVYKNGQSIPSSGPSIHHLPPTMHLKLPAIGAIGVRMENIQQARLIDLVPGQIVTKSSVFIPRHDENGRAVADPQQDIAKVCVFDRHEGSGRFGVGFVRGFGMKFGAIGSSVSHDSHNLIIVGMTDEDILHCAEVIRNFGGGQAAVFGAEVVALPLPIAGLLSSDPCEEVITREHQLDDYCRDRLGITLSRPFAALSFMALPVIPSIRITDRGLFTLEPGSLPQKVSIFI